MKMKKAKIGKLNFWQKSIKDIKPAEALFNLSSSTGLLMLCSVISLSISVWYYKKRYLPKQKNQNIRLIKQISALVLYNYLKQKAKRDKKRETQTKETSQTHEVRTTTREMEDQVQIIDPRSLIGPPRYENRRQKRRQRRAPGRQIIVTPTQHVYDNAAYDEQDLLELYSAQNYPELHNQQYSFDEGNASLSQFTDYPNLYSNL
jgi:hypothetical protein